MDYRLLNALSLLSIAMIVSVLYSIRRAHIRVEYSVSWLLAAFILLGMSRLPIATLYLIGQYFWPDQPSRRFADGLRFRIRGRHLPRHHPPSPGTQGLQYRAPAQRVAILEYRLKVSMANQRERGRPTALRYRGPKKIRTRARTNRRKKENRMVARPPRYYRALFSRF